MRPDVEIENHGSIYLVCPFSAFATEWPVTIQHGGMCQHLERGCDICRRAPARVDKPLEKEDR